MRRVLVALLALLVAAEPAWAKPRGCFRAKEAVAEENIRHAVRLREGANRCQELGYTQGTAEIWQAINQELGPQLQAQMETRNAAFRREFEARAGVQLQHWNGRIVAYFRHRPLSDPQCDNFVGQLKEVREKGWGSFTKQAKREAGEVRMDYRICS